MLLDQIWQLGSVDKRLGKRRLDARLVIAILKNAFKFLEIPSLLFFGSSFGINIEYFIQCFWNFSSCKCIRNTWKKSFFSTRGKFYCLINTNKWNTKLDVNLWLFKFILYHVMGTQNWGNRTENQWFSQMMPCI